MGINDFKLKVVGCGFDNSDGTSRQEEIERCTVGEPIELAREPNNPVDPQAVAVISARGVQIGYLGADRAAWVGSKITRGYDVRAVVSRVRGGRRTGLPLSVVLSMNMEGDEPDP